MLVTPQKDGSLWIEEPEKTAGFDLGNRSLFVKTNGKGDLNQIYFAHGAHAGTWKLNIIVNDQAVKFPQARAIGRLWQLFHKDALASVEASVFLEEKMTAAFESIEVAAAAQELNVEATLSFDITPPPAPKGFFNHLVAVYVPRLPAFAWRWGWGLGRWLQTPAPRSLHLQRDSLLTAEGKVAWQFTSNRKFSAVSIHGKQAEVSYRFTVPAGEKAALHLVLAETGTITAAEALQALPAARQSAADYAAWLNSQVEVEDPLLRSLYAAGLNTSRSMFKEFPGGFKGLVAGPDYAYPPRIYYRDSYWTAQALLDTAPELVREHLLNLAAGVHPDGQCPSGVFAAHLLKVWHAPANCDADWLANHFDSPSFFILLLNDYLQKTGDWDILKVVPAQLNPGLKWPSLTVAQKAHAAIEYLISRDSDGDGLIEKPYLANDWADNIKRSTWVSYDQGLYIAALKAYAGLCERLSNGDKSERYTAMAEKALQAMYRELWDEDLGYFVNYRRPGFTEKNLSVDTLVVLHFHVVDEAHTVRLLDAAKRLLRASNNTQQPYGDYGLLCAYPIYSNQVDLFDKSASPYWYHNGADWPYWDGMLAGVLLERRDPLALDVLTRWWVYGLEQGWLTPVEYYSPAFPVGGMLQGWSSMPAASMRRHLSVVKEQLHEAAKK
jgi:glycogen debranching enzyme